MRSAKSTIKKIKENVEIEELISTPRFFTFEPTTQKKRGRIYVTSVKVL
jgi:hypothetical protein